MRPRLVCLVALLASAGIGGEAFSGGKGPPRTGAAAAARSSGGSLHSGETIVRTSSRAGGFGRAHHRILFAWLPRGRAVSAGQRSGVGGDAALAQPQLGASGAACISRTFCAESAGRQPLAWNSRRRHVAA